MPIDEQVHHAIGLASAVPVAPTAALDLGAGGGVPGLVLAVSAWSDTRWVLVESSLRRVVFLQEAVRALGIGDRVTVVRARAEEAGRYEELRHKFGAVLSRSFGPPAVTAECAAPFLAEGGVVVVSEPPNPPGRWPSEGLGLVSLCLERSIERPVHAVVLRSLGPCDARYPRRVGVPAKRPLF